MIFQLINSKHLLLLSQNYFRQILFSYNYLHLGDFKSLETKSFIVESRLSTTDSVNKESFLCIFKSSEDILEYIQLSNGLFLTLQVH